MATAEGAGPTDSTGRDTEPVEPDTKEEGPLPRREPPPREARQRSEERYRTALANSGVVLFEQDASLRYTWIDNTQFYDMSRVIGRTDAELFPEGDASRLVQLKRDVLRTGVRACAEVDVTMHGKRHVYVLTVDPVIDSGGSVVGLTGASRDVTVAKENEERLARAIEFRDEMIGILGHDLRNPLGAIYGATRLLVREGMVAPAAETTVRVIERSAKRMLEMIGTMLDFAESRFNARLPVAPGPTDLGEVVRAVVTEAETSQGRRVEFDVRGDVRGTWDGARLAQVASNLIGNALKHGAPDGAVRVVVRGDGARVVLEVRNDGRPVPPERRRDLFQPFKRFADSDSSTQRGLGLGLYIADQIVLAHGGTIDLESTLEEGTTFRVILPRDLEAPK